MKKKLVSVLLSTAMVAGVFSGLGISASAAENEIYMFISSPEYADAINELIDAYKEVEPDVTINYETTQNDYPTLLKAKEKYLIFSLLHQEKRSMFTVNGRQIFLTSLWQKPCFHP